MSNVFILMTLDICGYYLMPEVFLISKCYEFYADSTVPNATTTVSNKV